MLDNLYRFDAADFNRPIWARLVGDAVATAAAAVSSFGANSQQLPFLVSRVALVLTGGAAQFPTKWSCSISDAAGNSWATIAGGEFASTAAAGTQVVGFAGEVGLLLPPRFRLTATGTYNAGANANTTQIFAVGWYIPRGTLSLP